MGKIVVLITLVLLLALSGQASATLMAIWDFGPDRDHYTLVPQYEYVVGTPTLSVSGGEYDINGKDGLVYMDAAGIWHNAGQAGAWDNVMADSQWIMMINTTGWQDMTIRWDYRSEDIVGDLGPSIFDFFYRVGGGSWTEILSGQSMIRDYNWHPFSYNLSSISAIEGQSIVEFRVNDLQRGDESGGNFRFDNLELTGVPEPATILLLGLGGLALLRKRRKINRRER